MKRFSGLFAVLAFALAACGVRAEVRLPGVFSDHMVLQRELRVPVWGTAAPGEEVTVAFAGQTRKAKAGADGQWKLTLEPMAASAEPRELTVSGAAGSPAVKIADVLVGEVWVGSGQSNMQMGVGSFAEHDAVLAANMAAGPYPKLRLLKGGPKPAWLESTPGNIQGFSAMLFSFGLPLQRALDVPLGLMVGAVGGTPSGYWLSGAALKADAPCQELIRKYAATYDPEQAQKKYAVDLANWTNDVAAAKEKKAREPRRPNPPAAPGETTGGQVGHLYEAFIRPLVGYGIRGVLWDQGESGTALPGVDQYTLMGALIRGWRAEWGLPAAADASKPGRDFAFIYIQKPSGGGCAWDPADPVTSAAEAFSPLPAAVPNDGQYVETHIRIMEYPNTAMAISSDLGPNPHPVCKSGYGCRAAAAALGSVYGRPVEYYGPLYASHKVEGGRVRVAFTHVGRGLAFRHGGKLQGFALAGADKAFHWVDAAIEGDTVVLSCPAVAQPAFVRYGWANKRTWANLFNKDGLPAVPFRTDR